MSYAFIFQFAIGTAGSYPRVGAFEEEDIVYRQFRSRNADPDSALSIFEYTIPRRQKLPTVAHDSGLTLDTLITINRHSVERILEKGETLLLASKNGVFLAVSPKNDVEFLVHHRIWKTLVKQRPIVIRSLRAEVSGTFYFLERQMLDDLEKRTWKLQEFRFPVLRGTVSSFYGHRTDPISGTHSFHHGVDIAAASGTQIFASKSGTIQRDGFNSLYGYYIVVQHEDDYATLYGHLLDKIVSLGDYVRAGHHIAYMGNTGATTGPHVHFEIHRGNHSLDPMKNAVSRWKQGE